MKRFLVVSLLLMSATLGYSQCGLVIDNAHKLNNPSLIVAAARPLLDEGASVHVLTIDNASNPQMDYAAYANRCPLWSSIGQAKQHNLFVLVFSFNGDQYKGAVIYGSNFDSLFKGNNVSSQILIQSAKADFKTHNFDVGIAHALIAYGNLKPHSSTTFLPPASQYKPPVQSEPVQRTSGGDNGGFKYFILAVFLIGLVLIIGAFIASRRKDKAATRAAQSAAVSARDDATRLFRNVSSTNKFYADLSSDYSSLSNSVTNDPTTTGLKADEYTAIGIRWAHLCDNIRSVTKAAYPVDPAPTPVSKASDAPFVPAEAGNVQSYSKPFTMYQAAPPPSRVVIHEHNTYVGNQGPDMSGVVVGMLAEDALENSQRREMQLDRDSYRNEPSYSQPVSSSGDVNLSDDSSSSSGSSYDSGGSSGDVDLSDSSSDSSFDSSDSSSSDSSDFSS